MGDFKGSVQSLTSLPSAIRETRGISIGTGHGETTQTPVQSRFKGGRGRERIQGEILSLTREPNRPPARPPQAENSVTERDPPSTAQAEPPTRTSQAHLPPGTTTTSVQCPPPPDYTVGAPRKGSQKRPREANNCKGRRTMARFID